VRVRCLCIGKRACEGVRRRVLGQVFPRVYRELQAPAWHAQRVHSALRDSLCTQIAGLIRDAVQKVPAAGRCDVVHGVVRALPARCQIPPVKERSTAHAEEELGAAVWIRRGQVPPRDVVVVIHGHRRGERKNGDTLHRMRVHAEHRSVTGMTMVISPRATMVSLALASRCWLSHPKTPSLNVIFCNKITMLWDRVCG
jgi:hypothetical protein